MISRRSLIKNLFALGVVAALPLAVNALPAATAVPDEYGEFLERLHTKVAAIVQREGRGLRKIWIEPPRASGAFYTRRVHIELDAGPSLLDKLHFQFDEVSGSRLLWE